MQFKYRKIPYWKMIPIIIISIILYKLIDNADALYNEVKFFMSLLSYLFWAFAIAYLLNSPMVFLEKKLKIKRALSITLIYVMLTGIIVFSVIIIVPVLVDSFSILNNNFSKYVAQTQNWAELRIEEFKIIDNQYNMSDYLKKNIEEIFSKTSGVLNLLLESIFNNFMNVTSTIFKLILGLIISIYLLYDKEDILKTVKKILYAFFNKEHVEDVMDFGKRANSVFSRYITGKIIDSALIGLICFIFLLIINVPYALIISILVGLLNLIPYFGSIAGVIPAVLITLFISPIKALWVLIFLLVLGQIDGMVIAPKIIGERIGLSPILIMVAITLGGAIYGVVGMFIAVPTMALLKTIFMEYLERRLRSRGTSL